MRIVLSCLMMTLVLLGSSCREDDDQNEPLDPIYRGTWRSEMDDLGNYTVIAIDNVDRGTLEEFGPDANENFAAKVVIAGSAFTVGIKIFTLTEAATLESSTFCQPQGQNNDLCLIYSAKMVLSDRSYYRVDRVELR